MRFGTLLLINIAFAKSHLTTAEIGSYEIFLFVTALVCSFWLNSLIQSFLPLYKSNETFKEKNKKSPEIFNAFLLISVLSLIVVIILFVFKGTFSKIFTPNTGIPFFGLILIYIVFNSPAFLIEYIYLLRDRPTHIIYYAIIIFSLQLIAVALPPIAGYQMIYSIYGLVAVSVLKYAWLIILLKKYALFTPSASFMKEHIRYASPLIVSTLMASSAHYVDDFLVLNKFDSTTFAIFKYGAKEFPLVLLMANALSAAMISEFADKEKLAASLALLKKKSLRLMHLLFPISIAFLLSSKWLYPRVFNENFIESASVFNIYLLLVISRLVLPHPIIIGLKKTRIIMYASFAELIVNVSLSLILLQYWGIEGIAFATVIAFALQKIIWIVYNKSQLNIKAKSYIPIFELAAYSVILLSTFYFVTTI